MKWVLPLNATYPAVLYSSIWFSMVCFSGLWIKDDEVNEDLLYQLEGYNLLHKNRKHKNGGAVAIFVKDSYLFEKRESTNWYNKQWIEKYYFQCWLSATWPWYRFDVDVCESYFKNISLKGNLKRKNIFLAEDFDINLLHFEQNKKVQNFMNLMFQFRLVPRTNKPTRIIKDTISTIDHIITN